MDNALENIYEQVDGAAQHVSGVCDAVLVLALVINARGDSDVTMTASRGGGHAAYALAKEFCIRWESRHIDRSSDDED